MQICRAYSKKYRPSPSLPKTASLSTLALANIRLPTLAAEARAVGMVPGDWLPTRPMSVALTEPSRFRSSRA
ncbi:MAG: hypothetical protein ACK5ZN_02390, partial [Phycisphaerales bacterium]